MYSGKVALCDDMKVLFDQNMLQFTGVMFHFFSPLIFLLMPFCLLGIVTLYFAIYYKWRRGIEIFMAFSASLFVSTYSLHVFSYLKFLFDI